MKRIITWTAKNIRRAVIALIGFPVLIAGIIMIVTPGPAIVVIPLGLGILATEFEWAQKILHKVKEHIDKVKKTRSTP